MWPIFRSLWVVWVEWGKGRGVVSFLASYNVLGYG